MSADDRRSADDVATEIEQRRGRVRMLREQIDEHQRAMGRLERELTEVLAPDSGEAALAHNGVTARVEIGPLGSAGVNTAAVDHHREALVPLGLGPRERVVIEYPNVDALREAAAAIAAAGIDPRTLVDEPPRGPKLRWKGRAKADQAAAAMAIGAGS